MPRFQFSLHRLLDLRQLELQQLEMHASMQAQLAAAARNQAQQFIEQLAATTTHTGTDWLILHQGADALRQQANLANAVAAEHQSNHEALLAACAEQRVRVEALESLQATEHQEFLRRQRRRDEAAMQERILHKWQSENRPDTQSNHSAPQTPGADHLGRLSRG